MSTRKYDVIVWGATGFTGRLVAGYLARRAASGLELRVALAGRNQAKLEGVRTELAAQTPSAAELDLLQADSMDQASLEALAAQTHVLCTTVGPYAKIGEAAVAACVAQRTHYCDLTGEPQFIRRMIDRHHEAAKADGTRIVHCCGYDSIPSDIGTWMLHERAVELGGRLKEAHYFAGETKGGFSGGTAASMLNALEEAQKDRDTRRVLAKPYSLYPEGEPPGLDGSDQQNVRFDKGLGMWTAPFLMGPINTKVVRRSNALMEFPYGRDFRYSEAMSTGKGMKGWTRAVAVTGALGGFVAAASQPTLRKKVVERFLPKPGEGPSQHDRESGFFVSRFVGVAEVDGNDVTLRGKVKGQQDPGYGETSKMLGESAITLALDRDTLGTPGGVTTPAASMGAPLLSRLRDAGMTFAIES